MKEELLLIWKEPVRRNRHIVGNLVKHNCNYTFKYNLENIKEISDIFTNFPGFNDINKIYTYEILFQNIVSRLPNKKREDYPRVLETYDLKEDADDWEILIKTKGMLFTDNFEFVPVFDKDNIIFNVAGVRYIKKFDAIFKNLKVGDEVELVLEKNNKNDKYAVMVISIGKNRLGYVPKYYSKEISEYIYENTKYKAKIVKLKKDEIVPDDQITIKIEN